MTPERLLLAAMHSIIDTTGGNGMKKVNDYLGSVDETFERFAWLPKRMGNRKIIWLRKYIEVRQYFDLFERAVLPDRYYSMLFTPEEHMLYLLKRKQQ